MDALLLGEMREGREGTAKPRCQLFWDSEGTGVRRRQEGQFCSPWRGSSALSVSCGARTSEACATNAAVGAAQSEGARSPGDTPGLRLERGAVINSFSPFARSKLLLSSPPILSPSSSVCKWSSETATATLRDQSFTRQQRPPKRLLPWELLG